VRKARGPRQDRPTKATTDCTPLSPLDTVCSRCADSAQVENRWHAHSMKVGSPGSSCATCAEPVRLVEASWGGGGKSASVGKTASL
jgi:hypothetical protein